MAKSGSAIQLFLKKLKFQTGKGRIENQYSKLLHIRNVHTALCSDFSSLLITADGYNLFQ
jgi:hypothetical protein